MDTLPCGRPDACRYCWQTILTRVESSEKSSVSGYVQSFFIHKAAKPDEMSSFAGVQCLRSGFPPNSPWHGDLSAGSWFWRWSQEAPVGYGEGSQGMESRQWRVHYQAGCCVGPWAQSCWQILVESGERASALSQARSEEARVLKHQCPSITVEDCSPGDTTFPAFWARLVHGPKLLQQPGNILAPRVAYVYMKKSSECRGRGQWTPRRHRQGTDRVCYHSYCEFSPKQQFHHFQEAIAMSKNRFTSNEFLSYCNGQKQGHVDHLSNFLQSFDEGTQSGCEFLHDLLQNSEKQVSDSGMGDVTWPRQFYNFFPPSNVYTSLTISKAHGFNKDATTTQIN